MHPEKKLPEIGKGINPESIPMPFMLVNKQGLIVSCNQAFQISFPLGKSLEPNIHYEQLGILSEASIEEINNYLNQQQRDKPFEITDTFENPEGVKKEYVWSITFDESSQHFFFFANDITSSLLKAILKERSKVQNYYFSLFESFPVMVWRSNRLGLIDFMNAAWTKYTGYTPQEIMGSKLQNILHPADQQYFADALHKALFDNEAFSLEFRLRKSDDTYAWFLFSGQPYKAFTGISEGFMGFCLDITNRKKAETLLKKSEKKYKALFENSYDANMIIDQEIIVDCNSKAAEIFGYTHPDELKGKSVVHLSPLLQPDGRPSLEKAYEKILAAQSGITQSFEWKHIDSKGELFDAEVSLNRTDESSSTPLIQVVLRDISERKVILEELRNSKREAENARKTQSEFLSQMSHEIRTPLNAVMGLVQLLLDEPLKKEQLDNLTYIHKSANHLLGIINDILDFTRIQTGKVSFEHIVFQPSHLLKDIEKTLMPRFTEKKIDFIISSTNDTPVFWKGDPLRLNQILYNLVGNALKFTEKGKVELRLEAGPKKGNRQLFVFRVIDTGIGIRKERLEAIFEKFTQAETSTTRTHGGSGLGLAIARKLVEMQGGEMWVESEYGKGSEFGFELWYEIALVNKSSSNGLSASAAEMNFEGLRILLAEDDKMNQLLMSKLLKNKWKVELKIADNGIKALDMLKEFDFDLVLLDLQMPEMDGYDAALAIRQTDPKVRNPQIPIIALSADAFLETRNKVLNLGVNDFVTKPFKQEELYKKILQITSPHLQS